MVVIYSKPWLITNTFMEFPLLMTYHDYVPGLNADLIVTAGLERVKRSVVHHSYLVLVKTRHCHLI